MSSGSWEQPELEIPALSFLTRPSGGTQVSMKGSAGGSDFPLL